MVRFPKKPCNLTALSTHQDGGWCQKTVIRPIQFPVWSLCGGDSLRPHLSGHGYYRKCYQTSLRQLNQAFSRNEVVPPGLLKPFSYYIVSAWTWWTGLDHFIVRIIFFNGKHTLSS